MPPHNSIKKAPIDENKYVNGYRITKVLATTLQGDVSIADDCRSSSKNNLKSVVIKRTSKYLHKKGITIQNGKEFKISENIEKEANILKILNQQKKSPKSLIKYIDFFETSTDYYLVMENGGYSFLEFVLNAHKLIETGQLSNKQWRKHCKYMFAQMIQFQKWMHSKGYCNLDISMENILISHACTFDIKTAQYKHCDIKFIDFGLSECFTDTFSSKKYVGKIHYKSPKVFAKCESFDAREADIWSLGIVAFTMLVGLFPYNEPCASDPRFLLIERQHWSVLLKTLDRTKYMSKHSFDFVQKLLIVDASKRWTMEQICEHDWIGRYFGKK